LLLSLLLSSLCIKQTNKQTTNTHVGSVVAKWDVLQRKNETFAIEVDAFFPAADDDAQRNTTEAVARV
jgi:hypothetical protein